MGRPIAGAESAALRIRLNGRFRQECLETECEPRGPKDDVEVTPSETLETVWSFVYLLVFLRCLLTGPNRFRRSGCRCRYFDWAGQLQA